MNDRKALSILLAALAISASAQVHASDSPAAGAASLSPRAATSPAPAGGLTILHRSCTGCHEADQVTQARPAADWHPIIERMRGNGASISDSDAKILEDYLIRNHSIRQ